MKTKLLLFTTALFLTGGTAAALEGGEVGKEQSEKSDNEESEFSLEKGLVEKVFKESTQKDDSDSMEGSGFYIEPVIGVVKPLLFSLSNDYFKVDYDRSIGNTPVVGLAFSRRLVSFEPVNISANAEIGYSYKQGAFDARSSTDLIVEDTITLQWVPLYLTLGVDYRIPGFSYVTPAFLIGAGANWFYQSGTIDGIDQSFWIPAGRTGIQLTLFGAEDSSESTFGGVSLSAYYFKDIGSSQEFRGMSYSIGSRILF